MNLIIIDLVKMIYGFVVLQMSLMIQVYKKTVMLFSRERFNYISEKKKQEYDKPYNQLNSVFL
jgi:hypothetical protein